MESLLWISCIRFSLQLMVSEAAFLLHRPRREHFAFRLTAALAAYFIAASGWYTLLHQIPGDYPAVFVAYYLGLFMLTLGGIWFCFELGRMELIFVGTGGYAAEHMVFALCEIIQYATGWTQARLGPFWHSLMFRFLAYIIGAGLVYVLLVRRNRDKEDFKPHDSRIAMLALVMLMAAIVLSVFYSSGSFMEQGTVASEVVCPLYSTLCCLLVLLMEFYVLRENRMKREQETMEQLLQMANAQRKSAQESIDIINMKCHDLKHQISALARVSDEAARSEYVAEIQRAVSIYEADYHTGCEALDYVLREKTLISNQHPCDLQLYGRRGGHRLPAPRRRLRPHGQRPGQRPEPGPPGAGGAADHQFADQGRGGHGAAPPGEPVQPAAGVSGRPAGHQPGGQVRPRVWDEEHPLPGGKILWRAEHTGPGRKILSGYPVPGTSRGGRFISGAIKYTERPGDR